MERGRKGVLRHIHNPFPKQPSTLGFVKGQLLFDARALPSESFAAGRGFTVQWQAERGGSLSVIHQSEPDRPLWSTASGAGFVSAALGNERIEESRGSYALHDQIDIVCNYQTVEQITVAWPGKGSHEHSFQPASSCLSCNTDADGINKRGITRDFLADQPRDSEKVRRNNGCNCCCKIPEKSGCPQAGEVYLLPCDSTDADGTTTAANGPTVLVKGCLYTDAKLAQEQLAAGHSQGVGSESGPFYKMYRPKNSGFFSFPENLRSVGVRYCLMFMERRDHHLGFQIWLDLPVTLEDYMTRHFWGSESLNHPDIIFGEGGRHEVDCDRLDKHSESPLYDIPERLQWLWSNEPFSAFAPLTTYSDLRKRRRSVNEVGMVDMKDRCLVRGGQSSLTRVRKCLKNLRSAGRVSNIMRLVRDQSGVQLPQFNRIQLTYLSNKGERFYGFGEQFSYFDMKGRRVPIMVQEQGLGRGDQPITAAANLVAHRAGGDWHTTYAPAPYYMTSDMHSLYLEGYEHAVFDLTRHDRVQVQVHASRIQGRILHGRTPAELIEHYTAATGRMRELPQWITKGAIVGMQGGLDAVRKVWQQLQDFDVPISAFWLQDWVGQRKTSIGWQLWWNWEVDEDHYPNWEKLVRDLRSHGIQTMTYCNPFIAPTDEKPNSRRNLFDEAKNGSFLIGDNFGAPYMIPNTSFDAAMVDLTNPAARKWLKHIMHNMVQTGVRGWMADFGESLPFDSLLFSGEDPATAHNKYPEMWAELNREFVEEWEKEQEELRKSKLTSIHCKLEESQSQGDEKDEDKLVFFMRAGYRGSPRYSTLFWAGDQMVSWQRHDGIKSAVTGLLTSGLSGYSFNHSDIGGYCTVNLPFFKYRRSEELLMRWMELNAFSTIFRTHEGNVPAANSQFYSNERTLMHFARCAKMYKAWEFYRRQLVKEAAKTGMPVVRHLFLHYANDKQVQGITYQQFLVGCEILVVPVLNKGHSRVQAYFPSGDTWEHVWTGITYRAATPAGHRAWIQSPLGYPAMFVKKGSLIGAEFITNLVHEGVLKRKFNSTVLQKL